ncbi:extracellular solute-binding protein [Candidatus Gracilibacteria bacterium]|nr:extracellular solute-binding protein [Candidatus Gracilibacteria bacterium]
MSGGSEKPSARSSARPRPTPRSCAAGKLTVIHRTEYFQSVQETFRGLVETYAGDNGIQLSISTANPEQFGDFNAKMQAAVQAGNPPDVAYHTLQIPQLYFLDVLEDVTDVVEELINRYGAVVPVAAERNAFIEGRWWAVPFISNSGAWFARKDWLDEAGIDPASLTDYNSYRDAALQVSDPAQNRFGWGVTVNRSGDGHGFITHCIQCFGGRFVDETGERVTFNSPETLAAVQWLAETYTSPEFANMLPPGVASWTDTSNNEAYLAGTLGFTSNAFSVYAQAKRDNNPVFPNTAVLQSPMANSGERLHSGGNGWFTIFKGAQNADAAKELILYMLDPANFTTMVKDGGGLFLPAYKNLWTDEVLSVDPNFATLQELIFNETPYTGQAYPASPNAAIAGIDSQSITSQMMANVINGSMTAEQAVEDATQKMVQIFEELGLPQS